VTDTVLATRTTSDLAALARDALAACGAVLDPAPDSPFSARTPVTGASLFPVAAGGRDGLTAAIEAAHRAYLGWRSVPAPVRGGLLKRFGELMTEHQDAVADLIQVEVGKIRSEALGEVREVIDVCDYAVGLSRQLGGATMPSERPGHRLMETWHPLGVVGVISAFNFPAAVWAWNAALALVCGDTVVWKPSELAPLTAHACAALLARAAADVGAPADLNTVVLASEADTGALVDSPLVPVVSATGSERMGGAVAPRVAARFGRAILELGGNNAALITPSADLDLAVRGVVFAAAGTAGQRCTTLRRVIAHESVAGELTDRLAAAYSTLRVGDPFESGTLVGPLIRGAAYDGMRAALAAAGADGGEVVVGGERVPSGPDAFYVRPALVRMPGQTAIVRTETFAPILYVLTYRDLDEAIALHNGVPQGLSGSIFSTDLREAERFLAADGADCGIVNVNIGTSGAEIGGAFGGEKSTGGGRESGSDAWRGYMRRATNTVNYSGELPLAQGVQFG
jgi:aldehyde dehydrogenase (NAD+)